MGMADLDAGTTTLTAWWQKDERRHAASSVFANLQRIRQMQHFRFAQDMLHLQLYSDLRYVGFGPRGVLKDWADVYDGMMSRNLVRRICETSHSRVVKTRPQPRLDTDGASYELQEQAGQRTKYLLGLWNREKFWKKRSQMLMHSVITGTGALKLYERDGRVCFDVAPSWELWVDANEARYAEPRTLYQVRAWDREYAMRRFPKAADAIRRAPTASFADDLTMYTTEMSANMVIIAEAWHLGVADEDGKVTGGRRILCCDDDEGVIESDEWAWEWFPFMFTRYAYRPFGFWGCGLPELIAGSQLEIERIRQARYEAYRRWMPLALIERGSKIVKSSLSNLLGGVIEYTGTKPDIWSPDPVPPGWYTHEETEARSMYETAGISQLSASGVKPAGLNSGKALRTYDDLEASGLIAVAREDEEAAIECAEKTMLLETAIAERGKGEGKRRVVRFQDTDTTEDIEWSRVAMPEGSADWRVAPASALSNTFAGKLEDLFDLRDLGVISDPDEMAELLQIPDLRKRTQRHASHRRLLQIVIESIILGRGQYVEPEPTWNLQLGFELARDALLDSETRFYRKWDDWTDEQKDDFEGRHEQLRTFIEACILRGRQLGQPWAQLQQTGAETGAAVPPPGAVPPVPPGMPGAAPPMPGAVPPMPAGAPPGAPVM